MIIDRILRSIGIERNKIEFVTIKFDPVDDLCMDYSEYEAYLIQAYPTDLGKYDIHSPKGYFRFWTDDPRQLINFVTEIAEECGYLVTIESIESVD